MPDPNKPTKLSGILADQAKAKAKAESAAKAAKIVEVDRKLTELANVRRGETIEVPGLGRVRIELIGARAYQEIEADARRAMMTRGIELDHLTGTLYELERAVRTLAIVVRDPDDHTRPFGSLEEWETIDPDRILATWQAYGDVRERLDPVSQPLTADEAAEIEIAVKKKDVRVLRACGLRKLCLWLSTTDVPPSTSPTPKSSSGESPSAA